jgi:hypothetical protein
MEITLMSGAAAGPPAAGPGRPGVRWSLFLGLTAVALLPLAGAVAFLVLHLMGAGAAGAAGGCGGG